MLVFLQRLGFYSTSLLVNLSPLIDICVYFLISVIAIVDNKLLTCVIMQRNLRVTVSSGDQAPFMNTQMLECLCKLIGRFSADDPLSVL